MKVSEVEYKDNLKFILMLLHQHLGFHSFYKYYGVWFLVSQKLTP